MPTPHEIAQRQQLAQTYIEITDGLRAAGSFLDVLGGLVVLFLGLPIVPQFADSRHLLTCEPKPRDPTPEQTDAIERFEQGVAAALADGPDGWLE